MLFKLITSIPLEAFFWKNKVHYSGELKKKIKYSWQGTILRPKSNKKMNQQNVLISCKKHKEHPCRVIWHKRCGECLAQVPGLLAERQSLADALREPTARQPGGRHRPGSEALQEHPLATPGHKSQGSERASKARTTFVRGSKQRKQMYLKIMK